MQMPNCISCSIFLLSVKSCNKVHLGNKIISAFSNYTDKALASPLPGVICCDTKGVRQEKSTERKILLLKRYLLYCKSTSYAFLSKGNLILAVPFRPKSCFLYCRYGQLVSTTKAVEPISSLPFQEVSLRGII